MNAAPKRRRPHKAGVEENTCLGGHHNDSTSNAGKQSDDEAREARIDNFILKLLAAANPDERRALWNSLRHEIASRSLTQIRRMEIAKGLLAS